MANATYEHFIAQNVALAGANHIGVYNSAGRRIGGAGLQNLALPITRKKEYSFMCVSDAHLGGNSESIDCQVDYIRALKYAKSDPDIAFTTICGDTGDGGGDGNYQAYQNLTKKYATKPVYAITGNHESYYNNVATYADESKVNQYYGKPLYYHFTHGDDVYIMLGMYGWGFTYSLFKRDGDNEVELKFLRDTLEENRNKRCFVFFHVLSSLEGDSGEPYANFYASDDFKKAEDVHNKQRDCFLSLLRHYKNTVWFHGHSHAMFQLQELNGNTIYSDKLGYRSVHIPSLCKPTKPKSEGGEKTYADAESQGYIVDVYSNGIHLRGRDFVKGEFLPIASYWIDTTLQTVAAGTYSDPTGIIV